MKMIKLFICLLVSVPVVAFADKRSQLIYEIDIEKSKDFFNKVAVIEGININKNLDMGLSERKRLVDSYIRKNSITVEPPKFILHTDCKENSLFLSHDDYRIDTYSRYGAPIPQPVDSYGRYLPLVVCQYWN
ncbi:hypothetical protein [Acinetobacter puyangensis]|uniref:hypothetical protein n=1 Tax=Acinetobacter puyangensis TaxID=1096779 RepID=UPI003A4D6064